MTVFFPALSSGKLLPKTMIFMVCLSCFALVPTFFAMPVFAEAPSPLSRVYACMDLEKSEDRLLCYDKQVGQLKEQEKGKNLLVIDAQKADSLRKEAFGFSLPSLPSFLGTGSKKPGLVITVKGWKKSTGGAVFNMVNGQVWQVLSGQNFRIPKGQLKASIKKGTLSSYTMRLDNEQGDYARAIRIKRVK